MDGSDGASYAHWNTVCHFASNQIVWAANVHSDFFKRGMDAKLLELARWYLKTEMAELISLSVLSKQFAMLCHQHRNHISEDEHVIHKYN